MSHFVKRTVFALSLAAVFAAATAPVSSAGTIETTKDFLKFAEKDVGPYDVTPGIVPEGTPRFACLCKSAGTLYNAVGFVVLEFGVTEFSEYYHATCRVPFHNDPDPNVGQILSYEYCTSFQILAH